jgi:hypothetical protein
MMPAGKRDEITLPRQLIQCGIAINGKEGKALLGESELALVCPCACAHSEREVARIAIQRERVRIGAVAMKEVNG